MLQLSNWARLKVRAPPALVCTSCRHLLHHAASTSLPASPSAARAAAASLSAASTASRQRKSAGEAQRRPRRKSQSRSSKSTELPGETRDAPTNLQAGGPASTPDIPEAPGQADAKPAHVTPPTEEEKKRLHKRLKHKKWRANRVARRANEAEALGGEAPTETTDSTPKPSPYNPAQLSGAMKVIKSVLNKELYNERKNRETAPKQAKTKKTKKSKAEKAADDATIAEKATPTASDLPKPLEIRRVISNNWSELAILKKATAERLAKEKEARAAETAEKIAAAKAAARARARAKAATKLATTKLAATKAKARADLAAAATRAKARAAAELAKAATPSQVADALGRPPQQVTEYILNNTKVWEEKQALPYPEPLPAPPKRTRGFANRLFQTITPKVVSAAALDLVPVEKAQPPVPKLSYGLDRVLFNPGVYHLQDPRTRVYNFDPYLARIMPIKEFDFTALKQYITSSKDTTLIDMAAKHKRKYTGSTSSMTSMLAHFHFLLSAWRRINPLYQSAHFELESQNFSAILRSPAAAFLHYKDGVYAIDADKEFDTANILSMLGKSMEKLLTLPKEDFEKYRRTKSDQLSDQEKNGPEAYHYTTMGDFMMRSQLDAFDPRIPGTGMFDLKTRAVASIRFGINDIKKGLGYEIRDRVGQWESYEREYHDMIRSAFIKYSLQVRMGRMDGIFVAFHNTQRIFGFQYISLSEMDHTIHGTPNPQLGDREFKLSLHLLNELLDKATKKYPKRSLRLHFETRESDPPFMYAFAEPVTPEQIEKVQGMNQKAVEEFENEMMGVRDVVKEDEGAETSPLEADEEDVDVEGEAYNGGETNMGAWEDMMDKVEEVLKDEEQGVTAVRESIESALQQSGLLHTRSSEEARRYLDALLEALTSGEEVSATEGGAGVLDAETDLGSAEASVSETAEGETTPETAGETSADVAAPEGTTSGDQTRTMEGEVRDESTEVQQAQDGDVTEASGVTSASFEEPSLKDLILRLASQVKPKPKQPESWEEEDVTEDTLKLRKFESILSELIAKTREVNHPTIDAAQDEPIASTETAEDDLTDVPTPKEPSPSTPPPDFLAPEIEEEQDPKELLGMIITVRNKINNQYVERPQGMHPESRWEVEYVMEEIKDERAQTLYKMLKKRRRNTFTKWKEETKGFNGFREKLAKYARRGRTFRGQENSRNKGAPVHVYGMEEPLEYASVFGCEGKGGEHPDGMGYKVWKGEEGKRWEETEERREWAADLNTRPVHVPQFESTSSYHADNPVKIMEVQMRTARQEARIEEARGKREAASAAEGRTS